jgi:hypothetical protein
VPVVHWIEHLTTNDTVSIGEHPLLWTQIVFHRQANARLERDRRARLKDSEIVDFKTFLFVSKYDRFTMAKRRFERWVSI